MAVGRAPAAPRVEGLALLATAGRMAVAPATALPSVAHLTAVDRASRNSRIAAPPPARADREAAEAVATAPDYGTIARNRKAANSTR